MAHLAESELGGNDGSCGWVPHCDCDAGGAVVAGALFGAAPNAACCEPHRGCDCCGAAPNADVENEDCGWAKGVVDEPNGALVDAKAEEDALKVEEGPKAEELLAGAPNSEGWEVAPKGAAEDDPKGADANDEDPKPDPPNPCPPNAMTGGGRQSAKRETKINERRGYLRGVCRK